MPAACYKGHNQKGTVNCHNQWLHPGISEHEVEGVLNTGLSSNVYIEGQPAAILGSGGSETNCPDDGEGFEVTAGSSTVFINGKPAVRKGDPTDIHGQGEGAMDEGAGSVFIG